MKILEAIAGAIGVVLAVCFGAAWFASSVVGAVYWVIEDEALHAVLSVFIPLYGIVTVAIDLIGG